MALTNVHFDENRAVEVVGALYRAHHNRIGLYALANRLNGEAPQRKYRPEGVPEGSPDDLLRLYFAALTDRRQVSSEVYQAHVRLWQKCEWLYRRDVLDVASWEPLSVILREQKVGIPVGSAKNWLPCAKTLYSDFESNPLNLYREGSIDAIVAWKQKTKRKKGHDPLPGFGPKILSLLALFYEELDALPHVSGAFPVDVHIQRIFISNGVVVGSGIIDSANLAEFLRPRICEICYHNKWSALDVSHAGWFLGNRGCTRCHAVKDAHALCPVFDLCGGGIVSESYFREGSWDLNAQRRLKGLPNHLLF